jgi:hypothetical protein
MRTEWNYRNTMVRGSNDQEMAAIIKKASTNKVREYYNTYRTTPTFILRCHHYLFTSRSLDQRIKLDIDSLNCWIRSVEDAIQALIHHNNQQIQQSAHYFAPFLAARRHNQTSAAPESSDSEYSVSSIETSDNTMTMFTSSTLQSSSNTMDTISSSSSHMTVTTYSSNVESSSNSSDPPPSLVGALASDCGLLILYSF